MASGGEKRRVEGAQRPAPRSRTSLVIDQLLSREPAGEPDRSLWVVTAPGTTAVGSAIGSEMVDEGSRGAGSGDDGGFAG